MGQRSKQAFIQRRQMAKQHMKICSTSLVIRETQIKTTMWYRLTSIRMTNIKKYTINAGEGLEKRELFYTVGGNLNWYSHYREQ